jgi:hypothetical protein
MGQFTQIKWLPAKQEKIGADAFNVKSDRVKWDENDHQCWVRGRHIDVVDG